MPGAVVGALLWIFAAAAFRLTAGLRNSSAVVPDDPTVALIGQAVNAVIATVLWAYLASIAILVGGELNAVVRGREARAAAAAPDPARSGLARLTRGRDPTRRRHMTELPDLSLDAAPAFLRAAGLAVERYDGREVTGTIEAGPEHHTPWGVVHGGVYAAAVESACSIGASAAVAGAGQFAVGLGNQTDFIRSHTSGTLQVRATPVHQGRTGQLWQCDITRDDGKLVAQGRVRLQNVPRPGAAQNA